MAGILECGNRTMPAFDLGLHEFRMVSIYDFICSKYFHAATRQISHSVFGDSYADLGGIIVFRNSRPKMKSKEPIGHYRQRPYQSRRLLRSLRAAQVSAF